MPMVIPLIAYAATYYLVGTTLIVAQLAALAASLAVGAMEQKRAKKRAASDRKDLSIVLQSAVEAHRTVYGRAILSGPLVYAHSTGADNSQLHRVIALTGHEIDGYEAIFFNDEYLTLNPPLSSNTNAFASTVADDRYMQSDGVNSSARIEGFAGTSTQSASSHLVTASGGQWTTNHRLRGRAYLNVQTNYSRDIYTEGVPNVRAQIRGKKIYDMRGGTTAWSRNPALVIRDYLTSVLQVPTARVDDISFLAAANICDEYVTIDTATAPAGWATYMTNAVAAGTWELVSGTTFRQRRYTFDGIITADSTPGEVLEQMVFSCAGYLSYTGGAWRLVAGAYTAPTLTLTENDLRGGPQFSPKPPRRSLANAVRGSFAGPLTKYQATDFPPVVSSTYLSDDGGTEMPMDVDLPFTNDAAMCQRLASIFLMRSRQGVLSFPATLTGLALRPGDTVAVTLPRFGFNGEVFRVEGWSLSDDLGVDLTLREEAASIYTWTPGSNIKDPSPQLSLPSPWRVPPITGLTATSGVGAALIQNDGTIIQRTLVSWGVTTNAFANKVEIETRLIGATAWTPYPAANDADGQAYLLNLKTDTEHAIRARRVNAIGARSDWYEINYTPLPVNAVENLLQNPDWTEDLGYGSAGYSDARALRGWEYATAYGGNFGRNYGDGRYWNIGLGGSWMHQVGTAAGIAYFFQYVPATAGIAYEASVYVSAHRCGGQLEMHFCDANKTRIGSAPYSYFEAGTGIIGDAYRPMEHPRPWTTGTAPAGTAYVQIVLLKNATTAGQVDSYAFWSKALICVAPTGVTRETATPWVDSGSGALGNVRIATAANGTSVPRVGSVSSPSPKYERYTQVASLSFTPSVATSYAIDVNTTLVWNVSDTAGKTNGTAQYNFEINTDINDADEAETLVMCITEAPGIGRSLGVHQRTGTLAADTTYTFKLWVRRPPNLPTTRSLYVDDTKLQVTFTPI